MMIYMTSVPHIQGGYPTLLGTRRLLYIVGINYCIFNSVVSHSIMITLFLCRYESKCETYWEYVLARVAAPHTSDGYIEDYISVAVSCNCVVKERSYEEPLYQIVDSS